MGIECEVEVVSRSTTVSQLLELRKATPAELKFLPIARAGRRLLVHDQEQEGRSKRTDETCGMSEES